MSLLTRSMGEKNCSYSIFQMELSFSPWASGAVTSLSSGMVWPFTVTLFVSNVYFWLKSGYFGANTETIALLHTWSLSGEEQFYVVFPIVLMLLWRVWRAGQTLVLVVLGVASFAACVWFETRDPSFNFFFAPSRAWELIAGSMVALHRKCWTSGQMSRRSVAEVIGTLGPAGSSRRFRL